MGIMSGMGAILLIIVLFAIFFLEDPVWISFFAIGLSWAAYNIGYVFGAYRIVKRINSRGMMDEK